MYLILVYDFGEKRVGKALKICRRRLNWVQNSVFEGEITESQLKKLQLELKKLHNPEEDSILFYRFRSEKAMKKTCIGLEKNSTDQFL